jgi:putative addiction module component (TIGR02574 family)
VATDAKQVLKDALQLPERERADIAAELLASLPQMDTRDDDAWIAEVERRARTAMDGVPGLTWDETRAKVERRLSRK